MERMELFYALLDGVQCTGLSVLRFKKPIMVDPTDGSFLIGAHFCARAGCIGVYKSAPQSKKTGR